MIEIDPAKDQARLIISRHQRQQVSPLEDSKLTVYDLRSGPHDEVYVMGGIPVSDALPRSLEALAFSPNDSTWRAIKPSEWQDAERLSPQVSIPIAFGKVVYNWAGGPQYWADDRNAWYGQPTQAILYGDATTGGIVSIPFTLTLEPDFGRQHLPNATKLTDNAVARRVRETSQAWLFTPAGVLFWDSKQPFWWFMDADEIRKAAHAQAQAAVTPKFKQPLVLSEAKVGRRTQLHATTEDGQQAVWLKSLWNDRQPVVSPDGRRVAFVSERLQNKDIYLIHADGSGVQNLTDSWADESEPQFSADGKRLTFRSTHRDQSETQTIDLPDEGNAIP